MERSPTVDESHCMTSSYHEIHDEGSEGDTELELSLPGAKKLFNRAKNWVGDLSLDGVVTQEGQQVTYVAQDLTQKIKLASPTKSVEEEDQDQVFAHDPSDLNSVVNDLEIEAKKLATSLDQVTENLTGILHSLSSMTLDCVFTASDGVTQLCDTADASIKVMYQVMAKCEELNKAVHPIYSLHQQIKDTKRLLDKVEAELV